MKRGIAIFIICLTLIPHHAAQATEMTNSYEKLLEDVTYTFLMPLNQKAINDYFGEVYMSYFCKFVEVKRKPDLGYSYEITYQFITYERALMPPFHLFTLTVENEAANQWVIKEMKVEKLEEDTTKANCRVPVQMQ